MSKISSPCISVCALDADDICIGCQRSADEISAWSYATEQEKREIMEKVAEREGPFLINKK